MVRKLSILIFFLIANISLFAQQKNYLAFIPKDYDTLQVAKGDLNRDGIADVVLAVYPIWEKNKDITKEIDIDSLPQRLLIVLFNTKKGYIQAALSQKAILCIECGGIFGDPFAGIEITKNVLFIQHYGGSAWRWSYTHKFRYQNKKFYLIGQTINSYWNVKNCDKLNDFAGTEYEDINFITGQYERKKISENCELLENKKGKRNTKSLISLSGFDIDSDDFIIDN